MIHTMRDALAAAQLLQGVMLKDPSYETAFNAGLHVLTKALSARSTLFIAGNGGSAAEAQHFAAEIVGRYKRERSGYPAISLSTDTSALTAISNDYGFEEVFSRQLEALGSSDDVLVLLSTSGNSPNLLRVVETAKAMGIKTIALLGKGGGALSGEVDVELVVPSDDSARIQEIHLLIIHAWCELVEKHFK